MLKESVVNYIRPVKKTIIHSNGPKEIKKIIDDSVGIQTPKLNMYEYDR